jgi:asparagine synthase (glutamine-hydrolysing)
MCGLAGILVLDGEPPDPLVLGRMGLALAHRGPDSEGLLVDDHAPPYVGFVHRRLSIIDLSRDADQPLGGEDGSVQCMLNGEIYNFRELRRELESRHVFRSRGDTEVIVHGYEERGDDIIGALDGMFALALWDSRRRRLLLARDAFGKKPLYYWSDGRRLVFASEIKGLFAAGVPAEMDSASLGEYLAFGYTPTPRTLFRGIHRVPAASFLVADANGVHAPKRYWDLGFPAADTVLDVRLGDAAAAVRGLLTEAVRKRLMADVPLGVLLSGGMDSSAVAALMTRLVPGRVKSFTVGFDDSTIYDERAHAERVAMHIGTEHHASVVTPQAATLVQTLLDHYDEPFGDSSALPTYLVAREARRHVTVAITGDGGDEGFAGYDRFYAAILAERIPIGLRRVLERIGRLIPEGASYRGIRRRIRRFTDQAPRPIDERVLAWAGFFDLETLQSLDSHRLFDPQRILESYDEALAGCEGASCLSRLLYLNVRTYLLDDLLPKVDRMTMAHGLEARSPLLDRPLMEYVATLPDTHKRRGFNGKIVLKKAVQDLLPLRTLRRPKQGFGVPVGDWFRRDLRPMMEDIVLNGGGLKRYLRMEGVRTLFEDHVSKKGDRGHQLWALLTLELWLRKYRFD